MINRNDMDLKRSLLLIYSYPDKKYNTETRHPEQHLVRPANPLSIRNQRPNIPRISTFHITRRSIVTNRILIHTRPPPINPHSLATIHRHTPHLLRAPPHQLRQMPNLLKDLVRQVRVTEPRHHRRKLAMVPELGYAGGDVEGGTRDDEEILSLACIRGQEVSEVASTSGKARVGFALGVPG